MADPASPTQISENDLRLRDAGAIAYSKSMLLDGDTLVFIKYPGSEVAFDATGFALATCHRVHSHKLIGTGSKVFAKMFDPLPQARFRRSHKYTRDADLPSGIQYVIDLTPPDEGEEAVEQISNLSCPKGILYWATSESRLGVSGKLVGGRDEFAAPRVERPASQPAVQCKEPSPEAKAVTNVVHGFVPNVPSRDSSDEFTRAIEESRRDSSVDDDIQNMGSASRNVTKPVGNGYESPKEYCPIRHRAGIERLLQIIENKEPRLDSAPKIWTISMLSKFFDCEKVVVDAVCTWVLRQKNSMILEVLPEACLRLGLTLQSQLLTRGAYSILVSEEALFVAGQDPNQPAIASNRAQLTRFGRLRDEIDEDTLNMVQHAGRNFATRIDMEVRNMVEENMAWLTTLPEHHKLQNLALFIEQSKKLGAGKPSVKAIIEDFMSSLTHYVRGRLFFCLVRQLYPDQITIANSHRNSEQYLGTLGLDFKKTYDSLSSQERVATRQFWENVQDLGWNTNCTTNLIYDKLDASNPHSATNTNLAVANFFRIKKTWMGDLYFLRDNFNELIIDAISTQGYMGGDMPREAFPPIDDIEAKNHEDMVKLSEDVEKLRHSVNNVSIDSSGSSSTQSLLRKLSQSPGPSFSQAPRIPPAHNIPLESPFFDLPVFLQEVGQYIQGTCDKMLSRGENPSFILPDTLLCLTDEEYKYLPLFAGGFDDGTSGVYQDTLPPAIAGPSGPGPAYHTGFSLASAPSSEVDFGDDGSEVEFGSSASTIGHWSRDVDNGFSDHIDRRRVRSEVSFGTMDFSDLGVDSEIGKGKGKGKGRATESESTFGTLDFSQAQMQYAAGVVKSEDEDVKMGAPGPVPPLRETADSIMDDDSFFCEDEGNDFEFEDDSGNETEKEVLV